MASKKASGGKDVAARKATGRRKDARPRKDAASGEVPVRERLEKELLKLLPEIDDQGLVFLLKQANVLVNNARVDRINREILELRASRGPEAGGPPGGGDPAARDPHVVSLEEQGGGKVFFLTIGGARKVLSLEELRRLGRICRGAETKAEALRQLYAVLSRDRNDILFDARIRGASHPLLDSLYTLVRTRL